MHFPISLFIGLRYLKGRNQNYFNKFISHISTFGILIGVMSLIIVLSVMNGFESKLKGRLLELVPQAVITSDEDRVSENQMVKLNSDNQLRVKLSEPIVQINNALVSNNNKITVANIQGISNKSPDPLMDFVFAGNPDSLIPNTYNVILSQQTANQLNVSIGDKIDILIPQKLIYSPMGLLPAQRQFKVSGIYNTGTWLDKDLIVINIKDAQKLLRLPSDIYTGIRYYLRDPFKVDQLEAQNLPKPLKWKDWRTELNLGTFFQSVAMERKIMGFMLGLIILVAGFNMISSLILVVLQKKSEIAVFKTLGLKQRQIIEVFIIQGATSGIIGSILGGVFGVLIAKNINSILNFFNLNNLLLGQNLPISVNSSQILLVIILAIFLSVISTIFPAYQASKVNPSEELRHE
ncbi:lipoprotein-releasing system transmembrane subunit LolC [Paraphotobacterium marinum]|uniref:Lipoprotein-releasing system transmembrane subunit LolC n=1 Tax=Paraphotobacterium marinum TaxID=1755811 RepID=A0A220VDZ4_9GAMM|nr:lipoprotein-releasing ABC transporter permease subunit [Paraphotobacterium marinum]ASK78638.1 lipoprotein-releasing system transmembrane subunit LolC [Paraphotobacterium marinum]